RWEPYQAPTNKRARYLYYYKAWFDQGLKSSVYTNAPAGLLFPGDTTVPESVRNSIGPSHWGRFAPRLGLAWDVNGNGLMTIRAAYGIYTEYPQQCHSQPDQLRRQSGRLFGSRLLGSQQSAAAHIDSPKSHSRTVLREHRRRG